MGGAWSRRAPSSSKEPAEVYETSSSPQSLRTARLCCPGGSSAGTGSCFSCPAGWGTSSSSSCGSPGGRHPRSCRARVWFRCRSPCLRRRTPRRTPSPRHCRPGSSSWSAGWDVTAGCSAGQSSSHLGSSALRTHTHAQISCRQETICQTSIPRKVQLNMQQQTKTQRR